MGLHISLSYGLFFQPYTLVPQVLVANPPHPYPSPKHAADKTTLLLSHGPLCHHSSFLPAYHLLSAAT